MEKKIVALSLAAILASGCLTACSPALDKDMSSESTSGSTEIAMNIDDSKSSMAATHADVTDEGAAVSGSSQQVPKNGYSINAETNVIETPYYTVRVPKSWVGHYKAWFASTDLGMCKDINGNEVDFGGGCEVRFLLVDADDPNELVTDEDFENAEGAYSVSMLTDTWGTQGDYSVVRLGGPKAAPGWHVEVSGPSEDPDMTDALADGVTLK